MLYFLCIVHFSHHVFFVFEEEVKRSLTVTNGQHRLNLAKSGPDGQYLKHFIVNAPYQMLHENSRLAKDDSAGMRISFSLMI